MNEVLTMSAPTVALAGFAGWTMLMAIAVVIYRGVSSQVGTKIAINKFSPYGDDLPDFGQRITRVHLNCVETLPIFAAVVSKYIFLWAHCRLKY